MANVAKTPNAQCLGNENSDATIPVVVVGGGVVRLCTAYNLAKAVGSQQKLKITVLDARPSTFTAASSHNTGCLHYGFHDSFGKDITPLVKYSFELWQSIARSDTQFVADTGYRPQSFFPIIPGEGKDEKALPNWVVSREHWDVDWGTKGVVCATVNPGGIGKWLMRECTAMGVEVRTSTTAVATILSDFGAMKGVECASVKTGKRYILPCQKLVLTAGPWTPSQVKILFPGSPLDLKPSTNAGDWIIFQNQNPLETETTAVVFFDDIVHEKLEYAGRNDGSIWVCGRRNYVAVLPLPSKEDQPDNTVISNLIDYSERFIRQSGNADGEKNPGLAIIGKGRAFRPSTVSGLPFISGIPSKYLCSSSKSPSAACGVFICYGHGSYGITLGMGSRQRIAQLVCGQKPDLDLSKFTIT